MLSKASGESIQPLEFEGVIEKNVSEWKVLYYSLLEEHKEYHGFARMTQKI